MLEKDFARELEAAHQEIQSLRARLEHLEDARASHDLPETMLLNKSFLKRAFAVLGHYFVASLIITIPIYVLIFLIVILANSA